MLDLKVLIEGALRAIALRTVFNGTHVVPIDFIGGSSVAFAPLIRDIEGHAQGLLVCLLVRLSTQSTEEELKT